MLSQRYVTDYSFLHQGAGRGEACAVYKVPWLQVRHGPGDGTNTEQDELRVTRWLEEMGAGKDFDMTEKGKIEGNGMQAEGDASQRGLHTPAISSHSMGDGAKRSNEHQGTKDERIQAQTHTGIEQESRRRGNR